MYISVSFCMKFIRQSGWKAAMILPSFDTWAWATELINYWAGSSSVISPYLGKHWVIIWNLFVFSWSVYDLSIAKLFLSTAVSLSVFKYNQCPCFVSLSINSQFCATSFTSSTVRFEEQKVFCILHWLVFGSTTMIYTGNSCDIYK